MKPGITQEERQMLGLTNWLRYQNGNIIRENGAQIPVTSSRTKYNQMLKNETKKSR